MTTVKPFRRAVVYVLEQDFTKEEYDKWTKQVGFWIGETQKSENPVKKAEKVLRAAVNGTKLNGEVWPGVEDFDLPSRIRQFCGWDINTGTGRRRVSTGSTRTPHIRANRARAKNEEDFEEISMAEATAAREAYKEILYREFPFLDNPVYEATVTGLADSTVKLAQLSESFLTATGSALKNLIDIRDSLKDDIDEFMKLLKIHPSQLKEKVDEGDRGNVGTLIGKWEEYLELAEIYEQVDAIQEAIQIIRQLEQVRVDGSPQLSEWLLWHKTACRGHKFTCSCGLTYDIHGGFSIDEMYAIAEQAYKTFGFGLKPIDNAKKDDETSGEVDGS